MFKLYRFIAMIVLVCMVSSLVPVNKLHAAINTIQIKVDEYENETLKIQWDIMSGVKSARITYHDPKSTNAGLIEQISTIENKATLRRIKSNYIYDIKVELFDTSTPSGSPIYNGLLNYLPSITFASEFIEEPMNDDITKGPIIPPYDPKGGREIGKSPKLHLNWEVPKVFDPDTDLFVRADSQEGLEAISNGYQSIYGGSKTITKLDYRINISQNAKDMSMIDAVIIDGTEPTSLKASISGDVDADGDGEVDRQATVARSASGMQDILSMNLIGRATELDPIEEPYGSSLGHKGILPGSVYYMNIQTYFEGIRDVVYLNKGSSELINNPYAYTPIRFQLSKDYTNNVYAKIYTINQGSLLLPELYYEIQTNTRDSEIGWETKAKMDPDYFKDTSGNNYEFGVMPILNVSSNNNIYYRVIVTSNGQDFIRSQSMTYQISKDTSTPAIPSGVGVSSRYLVTGSNPNANVTQKPIIQSTDVTIYWEKPLNWEEIKRDSNDSKGSTNDTYYCFVLNISQNDTTEPPFPELLDQDAQAPGGIISYGSYPAKYRLVRYVNAASLNIDDTSSNLKYTLKGLELFKGEAVDGGLTNFDSSFMTRMGIEASYPKHLLSNKVYYLQMYAVKGLPTEVNSEKFSSQKSITTSFTTLSSLQKEVPLPSNFMLSPINGNVFDKVGMKNTISLQFDTIKSIKWGDYDPTPNSTSGNLLVYELYMNTYSGASGWVKIGTVSTTDNKNATSKGNNVDFQFVTSAQKTYLTAKIDDFVDNGDIEDDTDDALSSFGSRLSPNTAYFFKIKAKLVMPSSTDEPSLERTSADSYIISVTTVRSGINPPDPQDRLPIAPTDFAVSKDSTGNLLLKSKSVAFNWLRQETDVKYTLICTSKRMPMNADPAMLLNDPIYQDFRKSFGVTNPGQVGITLDPTKTTPLIIPQTQGISLSYDRVTKRMSLAINKWLLPNKLYYFSVRAERLNKKGILRTSSWISIPVTTLQIQAPTALQPLNDAELGIFWLDGSISAKPEDFIIYIKGPDETNYRPLDRSKSTVTRDSEVVYKDNKIYYKYYGRIFNLKKNSTYSIAVYNGGLNTTPVVIKTGLSTRDAFKQIEISWHGLNDYKYEIAIKSAESPNYITLANDDLEYYLNADGQVLPYFIEENASSVVNDDVIYSARIKSMSTLLPNGTIEKRALKPNSKYDIRVRAVSVDTVDTTIVAYSKYIGPIQTRTEFAQSDYDTEEATKEREAVYLDRVKQIEKMYFWKLNLSNSLVNKVMLKGDKVASAIENSGSLPFAIDLTEIAANMDSDIVCIPVNIINMLNKKSKGMKIISNESEYTFRPSMIVPENQKQLKSIALKPGVKDTMLQLSLKRSASEKAILPVKTGEASKIHNLSLQAYGLSIDYDALKKLINDKLYNTTNGIVSQNLKNLSSNSVIAASTDNKVVNQYINSLIKQVEVGLSNYIDSTLISSRVSGAEEEITAFEKPMIIKVSSPNDAGLRTPYVYYSGGTKWLKPSVISNDAASLTFNVSGTGRIVIISSGSVIADVPSDYWAAAEIKKLASVVDLTNIFGNIQKGIAPDNIANGNEMVLLYEALTGKASQNTGMDIKQKTRAMGLDKYFIMSELMGGVKKQQAAAIILQLYLLKQGIGIDQLSSSTSNSIKDENKIEEKYYKQVGLCVKLGIMKLNEEGYFKPEALITRAEVITSLVRLLELTGDI